MAEPIHTGEDLTIYKMVLHRLPFLEDTQSNESLISNFILEVMYELEGCFKIDKDVPEGNPTHVGDEQYYSVNHKAIIADIVSVYLITIQMVANLSGSSNNSGITPSESKFLASAKAGSVDVSWQQFDTTKGSSLTMSSEKLMSMYRQSAIRKARTLGCVIDICNDCTTAVELMQNYDLPPFRVVTGGTNCGCGDIPERG